MTVSNTSGQAFIQGGAGAEAKAWKEPETLSEMRIGDYIVKHATPPPNAWYRFWQRALIGVTWKDLGPENDLATLRKLK